MPHSALNTGPVPLDVLPDPYVVVDENGALLAANSAFDRRLLSEPRALQHIATALETSGDVAAIVDGRRRVYSVAWSPCVWNGGSARLVRLLDVTNERTHGEQLEQQIASLEDMLDVLPASLLFLDDSGTIVSGNARWHVSARANGLTLPNAGIGANYLAVCERSAIAGDPDAVAVVDGLRAVLARKALAFEWEYQLPDGDSMRWYRLSIHALSDHAGVDVQHFDTTEAHRDQQERIEALAHFKAVFEGALDAMVLYDNEMRVLRTNDAVDMLVGAPASQFAGITLPDLVIPEDQALLREQHAALLRDGLGRGVLRFRRADGSVADVEYASRAHVAPGRHVAIVRDVTASRALEVQLRQAQKMEALGQLTGGIAHDFNNLLTVILAHADLLLSDSGLSPDLRDGLGQMMRASQRGAEMVRKLMAFGRREQLRVEPHSVEALIEEATDSLRRILPNSITLQPGIPAGLPLVLADATAVQQILLNLTTNARDAMRAHGGEIRLSARLMSGPPRPQSGPTRGTLVRQHLMLSIADTGIGMSTDVLARVFEPFYTTKNPGEGTGLGMAMVYGLMEQMGGHVTLNSQPGVGTTVNLHFRTDASARPTPTVTKAVFTEDTRGDEHILLVEDDEAIRALSAKVLQRAGYQVTAAPGGYAAASLLKDQARLGGPGYDLVLSDILMPEGDGEYLYKAVRHHAPQSRIVWVTGYAGNSYVDQQVHAPCDAPIILKPWTTNEFLVRIRRVLDGPPNVPPDIPVSDEHPRAG